MNGTQQQPKARVVIRRNTETARSSHYVCFNCRKQFRKPFATISKVDLSEREISKFQGVDAEGFSYPCPQCGQELQLIGKNFRAPKQGDLKGWAIARQLVQAGFGYGAGWAKGSPTGPHPTRLKDVPAFIERNRRKTAGEQILDRWQEKP
ncbi:hypothetical protein DAERI_080119 [Deinococcus aerius]|uniref:Uncharacterized protein n=1 Tax=Deinococcus aerius TaxID=200253 RepID=A0A2I9DJ64_9DEIO|nr:hypothetical protein [Deinococcus aerius]GBF06328.1 hypothetical protein DAERI_080119 [Deinococcus aerius]